MTKIIFLSAKDSAKFVLGTDLFLVNTPLCAHFMSNLI